MKIVVNGAWRELSESVATQAAHAAPTLEGLLHDLGFADRIVATALNGEFISASARAQTSLRDGVIGVEVLAPMQGG